MKLSYFVPFLLFAQVIPPSIRAESSAFPSTRARHSSLITRHFGYPFALRFNWSNMQTVAQRGLFCFNRLLLFQLFRGYAKRHELQWMINHDRQ